MPEGWEPYRPCGTCRQPFPGGNCPAHPKRGGYRPHRPRNYGRAWRSLRDRAIAAAGGVCGYCAVGRAGTGDHVIPISRGGRSEWDNVIAACSRCNTSKGDRTLSEWVESGLAPAAAIKRMTWRIINRLPV
jgi:5-methylcytosine-specific restriction endonuclease McrA